MFQFGIKIHDPRNWPAALALGAQMKKNNFFRELQFLTFVSVHHSFLHQGHVKVIFWVLHFFFVFFSKILKTPD